MALTRSVCLRTTGAPMISARVLRVGKRNANILVIWMTPNDSGTSSCATRPAHARATSPFPLPPPILDLRSPEDVRQVESETRHELELQEVPLNLPPPPLQ